MIDNFQSYIPWILIAIVSLPIVYYWSKWSSRCPKCKEDWVWKTSNTYDEPSGVTVQKIKQGGTTGTQTTRPTRTWKEETVEVGTRVTEKYCTSCGHQATKRNGYRKVIGSTMYTVDE